MILRPLSDELQKKAIDELHESPKDINDVLEHIKHWLQKQPHLNVRMDEQLLIAFLRGCKWSVTRCKEKLDNFYTFKTMMPFFFKNRDPLSPFIQTIFKDGMIFVLPKVKNDLGPRMCMVILRQVHKNNISVIQLAKAFFMILDILLCEDDDFVVSGLNVLADYGEVTSSYLTQYTPTIVANYTKCLQNGYPVRLKGYTCINTPNVLDTIFNNFCKPFLSAKLEKRAAVIGVNNSKKFLHDFPKEYLPSEYGGTNGTVNEHAEKWKLKVESYRDWFLEDEQYGCNEKLRQGKSKVCSEQFGVDGSFKKLSLD